MTAAERKIHAAFSAATAIADALVMAHSIALGLRE